MLRHENQTIESLQRGSCFELAMVSEQPCSYEQVSGQDTIAITTGIFDADMAEADDQMRPVVCAPHTASFHPAGLPVRLRSRTVQGATFLISLQLEIRREMAHHAGNRRLSGLGRGIDNCRLDEPSGLVRKLREALGRETPPSPEPFQQMVFAILEQIIRPTATGPQTANTTGIDDHDLIRVCQIIEDELSGPLTVERLADSVGRNKFTFIRAFKKRSGLTPYQFILERRVSRARDMIKAGGKSLAEVAYDTGFSSQSHMSTAFLAHFSISPAAYRKSVR